jgi:hypothetical protein
MAYDLCFATTRHEAVHRPASIQIEEAVHETMFSGSHTWLRDCPLLHRMQSYYADAEYAPSELLELAREAALVAARCEDARVSRLALALEQGAREAAARGERLFCFAD